MLFRRVPCWIVACSLLVVLAASDLFAQGSSDAQALTPWRPRLDITAGVGWINGRAQSASRYDNWYNDAAWYGVEAGFYLTENVKLEVGAGAAGEGFAWSQETRFDTLGRPIEWITSNHGHSSRTVSAGVTYQFGSNAWVHPYLGGGVDVDRVKIRTTSYRSGQNYPGTGEDPEVVTFETVGHAFAVAGAKVYFSQRVFLRADVKATGRTGLNKVIARFGLGVDF